MEFLRDPRAFRKPLVTRSEFGSGSAAGCIGKQRAKSPLPADSQEVPYGARCVELRLRRYKTIETHFNPPLRTIDRFAVNPCWRFSAFASSFDFFLQRSTRGH